MASLSASTLAVATHDAQAGSRLIHAVSSTNVYADVISQIGGEHVAVFSILNNPDVDPHTYESNTTDASAVARATLVVQNGIGYDAFMTKLEDASPSVRRTVLDVAARLGYKQGANPHLWYNPTTMPRVAALITATLKLQDPVDASYFAANLRRFDAALTPWIDGIARVRKLYAGTPVAITEPVFGYEAQALGLRILTPPSFAMAIMDGIDPSPQDTQTEISLFTARRVKVFFYNQQAVAPITVRLLGLARSQHIAIVGVYETKPLSMTYQQWMLAELQATQRALSRGISTEHIQ
jgi:zinc/manganese transport system substrate-binding protein